MYYIVENSKSYYSLQFARLAQSVERTPFKRVVVGSNPTSGGGIGGRPRKIPTMGNGGID